MYVDVLSLLSSLQEVAASSEALANAKPKVIKTNDQPQAAAIKASSTTPLSKHNSKITLEQTKVACAQLAKSRERFTAFCRERELNANRAIIFGGKRSDDDVARVDANEPRAAEDIKISVNEIVEKETVLLDEPLCEAIIPRSESSGKEVFGPAKGGGADVVNGSFPNLFEKQPLEETKASTSPQKLQLSSSSSPALRQRQNLGDKVAISTPANKQTGETTTSVVSPSSVQSTSKTLIAKLASVTSSRAGHGSYTSDPDHGSELLPQQWEKLDGFLDMTLEAISRAKSLDEVEDAATKIAAHATDPVEKTVLQEVLARLAEYKEMVPSSLSAIETSHAVESSGAEMTRAAEVRLVHRKKQLSGLEAEVLRLQDEDLKLESEIKQLADRKAKVVDHMKSTAAELDRANGEASKELDEFEKQHDEIKEAVENRMRAMERLAQGNASWKLFKKNLRR
ncbi:unnamed protein product [Linum tenue]|uniref:Uncharacterized protein n=1 Tax=Linum tenue TaxID=586396 RepID=A0AAV0IYJ7_9ROSI|nr:unnamed protein product [Linum tenue]